MTAGIKNSYLTEASKTIETILASTLPVHEKVGMLAEKSRDNEHFSAALAFKVVEQCVRKNK